MGSWLINRIVHVTLMLLVLLVAGIYATEAGKEVRVLCSLFTPGTSQARVDRVLSTVKLSRVATETAGTHKHLEIRSWFNLRLTGCSVTLEEEVVTDSEYQGLIDLFRNF